MMYGLPVEWKRGASILTAGVAGAANMARAARNTLAARSALAACLRSARVRGGGTSLRFFGMVGAMPAARGHLCRAYGPRQLLGRRRLGGGHPPEMVVPHLLVIAFAHPATRSGYQREGRFATPLAASASQAVSSRVADSQIPPLGVFAFRGPYLECRNDSSRRNRRLRAFQTRVPRGAGVPRRTLSLVGNR
jgi:hypothetical protein